MSYINPIYITDKYVKDLYDRNGLTGQLALTDLAVNRFVQDKGVAPELIPVDESGYATTIDVIEYALAHLYAQAFKDFHGANEDAEDKYKDKYYMELNVLRSKKTKATYDTILSNTNTNRSSFMKDVPVM